MGKDEEGEEQNEFPAYSIESKGKIQFNSPFPLAQIWSIMNEVGPCGFLLNEGYAGRGGGCLKLWMEKGETRE